MKLLLPLGLIALLFTSLSYAAGFDCTKAKTATEKAICSTTSLSDLDEILVLSFNKAVAGSADVKALKTAQQAWLKTREACASNVDCITKAYTSRISELINLVAKNQKSTTTTSSNPSAKPAAPAAQQTTNTTSNPAPTGKTLTGKITSYECGDNCYLTVQDDQSKNHVALCTAPLCESWNEVAEMPTSYMQKKVIVSLGRAKQYDGAGNEMGEMDAFESITLLE